MITLTADQFKQKYGGIAASKFEADKNQQDKEASLFDSVKNDITNSAQQNQSIYNQYTTNGDNSLSNAVAGGVSLAANTAGGVGAVAGDAIHKIPLVGPLVKGASDLVKGGFNALTDKLGSTKYFQEAAKGLPEGNNLEKGLTIASGGGQIAGGILGADQGVGLAAKSANLAKTGARAAVDSLPDTGGAGKYINSAIQDVKPTAEGTINHQIAKALDLTAGDLNNIYQSTGNDAGRFLADNNLIGHSKPSTQGLIQNFFDTNYKAVREEIGKVKTVYDPASIPRFIDTLKALGAQTEGTLGLEGSSGEIQKLLQKPEVTLGDVQRVKELLDEHYKLYKNTGDVREGVVKQGLAKVRGEIQGFIENEVKANTGADIRKLNNNVSTSKGILDAVETRTPRGITRANITSRDVFMGMGLTYFGSPFVGVAAVAVKKLLESPTVRLRIARWLDKHSDAQRAAISKEFETGNLSPETQKAFSGSE